MESTVICRPYDATRQQFEELRHNWYDADNFVERAKITFVCVLLGFFIALTWLLWLIFAAVLLAVEGVAAICRRRARVREWKEAWERGLR